jgi:hypothetical protein
MQKASAARQERVDRAAAALMQGGGPVVVHLFKWSTAGRYCLTLDGEGSNIPGGHGRGEWRYVKGVALQPGDRRIAFDTDVALAELTRFGYYFVGGWYEPG